MLKIFLILSVLLYNLSALACWKAVGTVGVDGETWKIDQKVEHKKEYSVPMGSFIFNMTVIPKEGGKNLLKYTLQEKKGTHLVLITKGEAEIKNDTKKEIYAKGEEGQPHSIITLKLVHI